MKMNVHKQQHFIHFIETLRRFNLFKHRLDSEYQIGLESYVRFIRIGDTKNG